MLLSPLIGQFTPPPQFKGLLNPNGYAADPSGLIMLISNLVKFFIILGGLAAFVNFLLAGFQYITQGDKPDELSRIHTKMYMSIIGLVVMVSAVVLTGIISFILYGDPSFILNPQVYGPNP
ncbi:hypothetical protein GYA49_02370 [Candidatus Beckwithbacteria bacterium]|nr:hypothetical protein [Candidatus Beckwithbacteria bacterium]